MQATSSSLTLRGSVRVDLLGGSIDLYPLNLILPQVVTLNVATSIEAEVSIEKNTEDKILIRSLDYSNEQIYDLCEFSDEITESLPTNEPLSFVKQIIQFFHPQQGLIISLQSGAPTGSGLGGSSAMGVVLFKALSQFLGLSYNSYQIVEIVKNIEARILNQGVPGYQDYYPALFGGILALKSKIDGVQIEQLYCAKLANFLEEELMLVYSNITRSSGMSNWKIYKNFFDDPENSRVELKKIQQLSFEAYQALMEEDYSAVLDLIYREGEARKLLADGIVPQAVSSFLSEVQSIYPEVGLKMCGAGGGGCFVLTHTKGKKEQLTRLLQNYQMQQLAFTIVGPKTNE